MRVSTLATGDELLNSDKTDSNFQFIKSTIMQLGLNLVGHQIVEDDLKSLKLAFMKALKSSDCIIATGGLGPTTDDLTKEALTIVLGRTLKIDPRILRDIEKKFAERGIRMSSSAKKQALKIEGAKVLPNRLGTAPGFQVDVDNKKIFLLPGPPQEMIPMFNRFVLMYFKDQAKKKITRVYQCSTFGLNESDLQDKIHSNIKFPRLMKMGYVSSQKGVDLKLIYSSKEKGAKQVIQKIKKIFSNEIYSEKGEDLSKVVVNLLIKNRLTLSVAESCTGGLLSQRLTATPGASQIFQSGMVVYSDQAKKDTLKISASLLNRHGAVSQPVAEELAFKVRKFNDVDIGLAITGIAGPRGGSKSKPVGTVYLALNTRKKKWCRKMLFRGDRDTIRFRATQTLLDVLRRYLINIPLPK